MLKEILRGVFWSFPIILYLYCLISQEQQVKLRKNKAKREKTRISLPLPSKCQRNLSGQEVFHNVPWQVWVGERWW